MYTAVDSVFVRNSLVLGYIRAPSVSGSARWRHVDPMWASTTTVCYRRGSLDNKRPAVWPWLWSMCGGVLKAWRESAGFWSRRLALKPWKLQNHHGDRHAEPPVHTQRDETISAAPRSVFCDFTVKWSADTCTDLRRTRSSSPCDNQGWMAAQHFIKMTPVPTRYSVSHPGDDKYGDSWKSMDEIDLQKTFTTAVLK